MSSKKESTEKEILVDWERQAKEFLILHGWKRVKHELLRDAWSHPCFAMVEDFAYRDDKGRGGALKFTEDFYPEAWKAYRRIIEMHVFIQKEDKQVHKEDD